MIDYAQQDSSFYRDNEVFCESVEQELAQFNARVKGSCTAYGFDIKATFQLKGVSYTIKYNKAQTGQNGVIIPRDANEAVEITLSMKGIPNYSRMKVGKNWFKRLYSHSTLKKELPSPYFIFLSNSSPRLQKELMLIQLILMNRLDAFDLDRATLMVKMSRLNLSVIDLMNEIDNIFNDKHHD